MASVTLLIACDLLPKTDGGEGGTGGSGGSGTTAAKTTGSGEGGGCDALVDCASCRACAADGPCKSKVDACLDEPLCTLLDECIALCGISPDCDEVCRAQYANVAEVYDLARQCLDCAVCDMVCPASTICQ